MNRSGSAGKKGSSLDIRSKLSMATLLLFLSLLFVYPPVQLGLFAVVLLAGIHIGISLRRLLSTLLPLLPILAMIVLFAGIDGFGGKTATEEAAIVWQFGRSFALTADGLSRGLTLSLRLCNMVIATKLLLSATQIDDFTRLFQKIRLPYGMAFALTAALRFIPELEKKKRQIIEAQKSRGADFESGGFIRRYYLQVSIMLPLIVNALDLADRLANALLIRGFGFKNRWTDLEEMHLTPKDIAVMTAALTATAVCIGIKIAI